MKNSFKNRKKIKINFLKIVNKFRFILKKI